MTALLKFERIIQWQVEVNEDVIRSVVPQEKSERIKRVEGLVGDVLPADLKTLYEKYDGENDSGLGSFLGHSFMGLNDIEQHLLFCKTLIKPKNPVVEDIEKSNQILQSIIEIYLDILPTQKRFGMLKRPWHKLVFECGPGSSAGPYFYPRIYTTDQEREILKVPTDKEKRVWDLAGQLHELEKESYNWDNLEVTLFGSGDQNIERKFYDFENELTLTSYPVDAIKRKYFHRKWLPLIHDGGNNFIGIDFDPGPAGTKGQIIVFGRDEEDMFVLSENWECFLALLISRIDEGGQRFLDQNHLHDLFKKELVP
ncbi:SMI1/KNR4 family protein [Pseudophaeobacter profundi]|jgi:cell wall assembly regulator SMI1|uniref:SMI1/KNR4 family protein n=1 Tax=Pseudophaeobacter profundi TaxID=3034152 RepID=UPI00243245D2|nr:SMI1/KNR4 family protein [Pseudophaeobacter profundi]